MHRIVEVALLVMLAAPAALFAAVAIPAGCRRPLPERWTALLTRSAMLTSFVASLVLLFAYGRTGARTREISYGAWFSSGHGQFALEFVIDGHSLGFAVLATAVCGIVAAFSTRYLHRETGFDRYFMQFSLFALGIMLVALAGSIELLFAGWELLGLSSTLLVGFFHERRAAVENALRVFAVYRASDAAMLSAAVLLHHWAGSGTLSDVFAGNTAALGITGGQALVIALLLLVAVAGKSALLPFSGWLPRAMEGPTPSSAVYYGALSIHAGCFLLLRAQSLFAESIAAQVLAALVGAATAVYASLAGRAQSDVKSALAYASLAQVGVIVVEIACGFTTLAFLHIVGHASFRLLQLLSAPNILHDLRELEDRLGERVTPSGRAVVGAWQRGLYVFALERGFVDALLDRCVVAPFRRIARAFDRCDRLLCGEGWGTRARQDRRSP